MWCESRWFDFLLFGLLFGFVLNVRLICTEQRVEKMNNSSVIANIVAVMEKMVSSSCAERHPVWYPPRPVISAVSVQRLDKSEIKPNNDRKNMYRIVVCKYLISESSCNNVGQLFQRVRVNKSKRDRSVVFVVLFVEEVHFRDMEGSVSNVKEKLFHEKIKHKLPEYGEFVRTVLTLHHNVDAYWGVQVYHNDASEHIESGQSYSF